MRRNELLILACAVLFFTVAGVRDARAAQIAVPVLELHTLADTESGSFALDSFALFDLLIEGGYKFGGRVVLFLDDTDMSDLSTPPGIALKSASAVVRSIGSAPLDLIYFIGRTDVFGSGIDFADSFGSVPFATSFRSYRAFGSGLIYDGIHQVAGTGIQLGWHPAPSFRGDVYLYQDGWMGDGIYSSDIRSRFDGEAFKAEAFAGATFPVSDAGIYRAGVMFYYDTGLGGEFLSAIGVPRWDPADGELTVEHFTFLAEPRVRLGILSVITTFFWHPAWYLQQPTGEDGSFDIDLNFRIGDPVRQPLIGGIENIMRFETEENDQLQYTLAPYLQLSASGILWDAQLTFDLFPFDLYRMVGAYFGLRMEL